MKSWIGRKEGYLDCLKFSRVAKFKMLSSREFRIYKKHKMSVSIQKVLILCSFCALKNIITRIKHRSKTNKVAPISECDVPRH